MPAFATITKRGSALPDLRPTCCIQKNPAHEATVEDAIEQMQSVGISQLPVVQGGRAVGSVQEITLARVLHDQGDPRLVTVGEIMAKPLPQLELRTHLDEAYRLLMAGNTGVLAIEDGKVVDIITRIDLIQYWNQTRKG